MSREAVVTGGRSRQARRDAVVAVVHAVAERWPDAHYPPVEALAKVVIDVLRPDLTKTDDASEAQPLTRRSWTLVKGLRKAIADPETEWIDANVVRLLLDRYDNSPGAVDDAFAEAAASENARGES